MVPTASLDAAELFVSNELPGRMTDGNRGPKTTGQNELNQMFTLIIYIHMATTECIDSDISFVVYPA